MDENGISSRLTIKVILLFIDQHHDDDFKTKQGQVDGLAVCVLWLSFKSGFS